MNREKKRHQQHPKTTSMPTNPPLSVSEPKKRDKDKQSADDSNGISKTNFLMVVKTIFEGGRFTRGGGGVVLPTVTLHNEARSIFFSVSL